MSHHLLYAARALRHKPAFAATAIAALALGIGGNTAMFSVIRGVLLKPLGYRDPDCLVRVSMDTAQFKSRDVPFSLEQFEHMRAARSFSGFGLFLSTVEDMTISGSGTPEALKGARVSANFLEILGVDPVVGRSFTADEDRPGGAAVAMISTALWKRRFGGDPEIAGRTVTLDATPYVVIGVLPAGFEFPFAGLDVWVTRPSEWPWLPSRFWRNVTFLLGFARLRPNTTPEQARAELNVLYAQYAAGNQTLLARRSSMRLAPLHDQIVANVRSMLWILLGAVACVLLIACANVANLMVARSSSRSREFAVRAAIGAGRAHLVGQLLAESLLLAAAGGLAGALLARWGVAAISRINDLYVSRTGPILPRASAIHVDGSVLLFTCVLSLLTGVLCGLFPAFRASRTDLVSTLRESGAAAGKASTGRLRGLLVAGQIAVSMTLLIGSALLLESFARLHAIDPGFQPENLLTLKIALPRARYDTDRKKTQFFDDVVQRVDTVPGVLSAAAALSIPTTNWLRTNIQLPGDPEIPSEQKFAVLQSVTPDYFRTLAIRLRGGRVFNPRDNVPGASPVMVINESLARLIWPAYPDGVNPVGERLFEGADKFAGVMQVIGVVADVHEGGVALETVPEFYVPTVVRPPQLAYLAVRTTSDPRRLANAIRGQVLAVDRDQPISDVRTMTEVLESSVGPRRLALILLGVFAGIAVLLAVVGIYGLISFSVVQRTQELGIRRALGAQHRDIIGLVVSRGLTLALAGIILGIAGAFALTRLLSDLLFHVKPTDPAAFLAVAVLFLVVALAASYFPARRATRIDPMTALRIE
ncbi:MAG TPA: ABC transporter permease [Bryobacteraceae bacterium]|jgi:predicted permease